MKSVLLLLCTGVELYEASAVYDVLGWADAYGSERIRVVTAGTSSPVRATFGLSLVPDRLVRDVDPAGFDALAVPGGFGTHGYYDDAYGPEVTALLRAFGALSKPIASICVGALPLAQAGLLTGRSATTYGPRGGERRSQLGGFGVEVVDGPIVRDGPIVTSTGPATAVDVAFGLLAELTSPANAAEVAALMGFERAGRG